MCPFVSLLSSIRSNAYLAGFSNFPPMPTVAESGSVLRSDTTPRDHETAYLTRSRDLARTLPNHGRPPSLPTPPQRFATARVCRQRVVQTPAQSEPEPRY